MALATNLARLRARIRKELQKEQPATRSAAPAETAPTRAPVRASIQRGPADVQRGPAGLDRRAAVEEAREDARRTAEKRAGLQTLAKVGGKAAGKGFSELMAELRGPTEGEQAFREQRAGERANFGATLPQMPADVQQALAGVTPGFGGTGFTLDRLPSDPFSLANLGPFGPSAQEALTPDPSQIFGPQATPTGGVGSRVAATPIGQTLQNLGINPGSMGIASLAGQGLSGIGQLAGSPELSLAGRGIGLGTNLAGLASGGLSGVSSLGGATSGAGALAAILGLIAQQTGNKKLGQAATVLGSTAGAVAGGTAAATGGAGAAAAASSLGLSAGIAGGVGAASGALGAMAIPLAVVTIADMFGSGGRMWPDAFSKSMGDWASFGSSLKNTLTGSGQNLARLAKALPFTGSKAELSTLLGSYAQGMRNAGIGGYGEGAAPFTIPNVPGAGGSAHEWGQVADFGPQVNQLQAAVSRLAEILPETGGPGMADVWQQFQIQDDPSHALKYIPQDVPGSVIPDQYVPADEWGSGAVKQAMSPGTPAGFYNLATAAGTGAPFLSYGDPRYPYAAAGLQAPGWTPASTSAAWQQMTAPRPVTPPAVPTPAPGRGPTPTQAGPANGVAPLGSSGFASLRGPRSELLTAEDPNRL